MLAERDAIQSLLGQVIRDRALREQLERDPAAALAARGLAEADREHILAVGVERLIAYHEMVHSRLFRTIRTFIGVAAEHLGDARLHADVHRFVAERGPSSPYLREVPREFHRWVAPSWDADDSLPPWLSELASHQILRRDLRNDPRAVGPALDTKIELEAPVVCNATARVLRYRWAVHRLGRRPRVDDTPTALEPGHAVVAFRSPAGKPSFLDIKPRSAALLELLLAGKTLREALFGACEASGEALDDEILSVTAVTLASLSEAHVLLGGRADP